MPLALLYVLLAFCVAALVFGLWIDGRRESPRFARVARFATAIQIGAVVGAYFVLRPGAGVDGHAALQSAASARQPVLLDVYSNW